MSQGRPLEFDPEVALQAAMEVFWAKGYEASSLQDLISAMRISKSSFYQAFGSKHQLFEACLVRFREQQVERMTVALDGAQSGMAFLRFFLVSLADEVRTTEPSKGCLIMNTATELAGRDPSVATLVQQGTGAFMSILERAVKRAQKEGSVGKQKDPKTLSQFLLALLAGMKAMVKAGASAGTVEDVAEVALSALK